MCVCVCVCVCVCEFPYSSFFGDALLSKIKLSLCLIKNPLINKDFSGTGITALCVFNLRLF